MDLILIATCFMSLHMNLILIATCFTCISLHMSLHMDLIMIATCFTCISLHMDLILIATCFMSLHMDLVSVRLMFLWQALNRNPLSWGSTWWRPVGSWFWLTGCWATYRAPDTRSSCSPRWLTCWTFYRIIWHTEVCTVMSYQHSLCLSFSFSPPTHLAFV